MSKLKASTLRLGHLALTKFMTQKGQDDLEGHLIIFGWQGLIP